MPDLKPCPFCSGKAHLYKVDYHGYKVVCMQCLVQTGKFEFAENAVARWNRRANDEGNNCYPTTCDRELVGDAREYIRQLERDKAWAGETSDLLREENKRLEERAHQLDLLNLGLLVEKAQLEAERDAAVAALKSNCVCYECKWFDDDLLEGHCNDCHSKNSSFEWRGVHKEE